MSTAYTPTSWSGDSHSLAVMDSVARLKKEIATRRVFKEVAESFASGVNALADDAGPSVIGQPVRLKSGGAIMTASALADDGGILCVWSACDAVQQQSIPLAALEIVEFSASDGWQASPSRNASMDENRAEQLAEDIECLHWNLDDAGIPREDSGNTYSLWGRVQLYKEMSVKPSVMSAPMPSHGMGDTVHWNDLEIKLEVVPINEYFSAVAWCKWRGEKIKAQMLFDLTGISLPKDKERKLIQGLLDKSAQSVKNQVKMRELGLFVAAPV